MRPPLLLLLLLLSLLRLHWLSVSLRVCPHSGVPSMRVVGGVGGGLLSKRSACIVLSDEGLGGGLWGVGRGCGGIVLLPSFLSLLFSHICRCIQSGVGRGGGPDGSWL